MESLPALRVDSCTVALTDKGVVAEIDLRVCCSRIQFVLDKLNDDIEERQLTQKFTNYARDINYYLGITRSACDCAGCSVAAVESPGRFNFTRQCVGFGLHKYRLPHAGTMVTSWLDCC